MNKKNIEEFFSRLSRRNPDPKTELKFSNNYQLLVSVILSAQATDISVNKATEKLYEVAPNPYLMSLLSVDEISSYINTIGLHKNKAAFIKKTTEEILTTYGGLVPKERSQLEALPGVGRKTANVILNTAFGEPVIAVDTHIFRISNRIGLVRGKSVLKIEQGLMKVIPSKWKKDAHHLMILHGRYVCKSRKPKCTKCVIFSECEFSSKIMS